MLRQKKDEKKYKCSLLSVLLGGISLILMINIGLGIRNCDQTQLGKFEVVDTITFPFYFAENVLSCSK